MLHGLFSGWLLGGLTIPRPPSIARKLGTLGAELLEEFGGALLGEVWSWITELFNLDEPCCD